MKSRFLRITAYICAVAFTLCCLTGGKPVVAAVEMQEALTTGSHLQGLADQVLLGNFSQAVPTVDGIIFQLILGDIPVIGTIADIRDVVGSIARGDSIWEIALTMLALVPVVGAVKFVKQLSALKYADDVADAALLSQRIPWEIWGSMTEKFMGDGDKLAQLVGHLTGDGGLVAMLAACMVLGLERAEDQRPKGATGGTARSCWLKPHTQSVPVEKPVTNGLMRNLRHYLKFCRGLALV